MKPTRPREYPGGKRFAFTIFDDTDDARLDNVAPLYELLHELGMRTTKTVWPVACPEGSKNFFAGDTMANADYLAYCQSLQRRGFEISWHCATMESSTRERTIAGLDAFHAQFGTHPRLHANHAYNRENLYWGLDRYRSIVGTALRALRRGDTEFTGAVEGSPYFWGDLAARHVEYVRNFAYNEIDTLRSDPHTPYRIASTRYAKYWFSASDAPDADAFVRLVTPAAIDRLAATNGVCILATHLGKGFVRDGRVDPRVEAALRRIASLPGWFAPTGEVLDYLRERGAGQSIGSLALLRLELRHLVDRLKGRFAG